MKKVLLLSLSLVLGFGAIAQQRVMKNDIKSAKMENTKICVGNEVGTSAAANYTPQTAKSVVVNRWESVEDGETMQTYYDLQSNGWCSNRMYQLPNGKVGIVATMSHSETSPSGNDRGTGYNFYNGSAWDDQPENRVEPFKTGWPTICQYGANGEVMISHAPVHCWIRETAGEGEWQDMGLLPDHPEAYPYDEDLAWPRVATSGDNHEIIHVIADLQHSGDVTEHHQVYYRSEDGGQTWITAYSPLVQDGEEANHYTADNYVIAANGHNVAMIYSDDLQSHMVMYKSTDDGQTWVRTVIWENPYYGCDWETDECSIYTDTMFGPCNTSMVIDNNGVVHVAMNTWEYWHTELGNSVSYFYGRGVDGIYYWNDTQEAPIQAPDGNPHHALRLWWPAGDGYVHMEDDSTKWIGYVPMYYDEDGNLIDWDNDKEWLESDYFYKIRGGASGWPALACDPNGNLACAFSTPCTARESDGSYLRTIIVSYYNAAEGYWHQDVDDLLDKEEFVMLQYQEAIFTVAAPNVANVGEFWFGYQADDKFGCFVGSSAAQTEVSDNTIHGVKVIADPDCVGISEIESVDPVYAIYPNPVTGNMMTVSSAMDADATITIVNLVGQTVKQFNQNLHKGENTISIDLTTGVYFCTINANGYNNTVKFVVK